MTRCQTLTENEVRCVERADAIVRERPDPMLAGIGWSGQHCKRHAMDVVDSHWHHIEHGRTIEIIPLSGTDNG